MQIQSKAPQVMCCCFKNNENTTNGTDKKIHKKIITFQLQNQKNKKKQKQKPKTKHSNSENTNKKNIKKTAPTRSPVEPYASG